MKKFLKIVFVVLVGGLFILLVGPFLIPVTPPEGVAPVSQLADKDSLFVEIDGIHFHYKKDGGKGPALVLLHGFGASQYSWREVMDALGENYTVYAYDRPAFGLTERPTQWEGENPYSRSSAINQLQALLDAWKIDQAVLVGNSAGGTVAMEYALANPERVKALILVSPAIEGGGRYSQYGWLFSTPQMQRIGPLLVRSISESGLDTIDQAWHDPTTQPTDTFPLYTKPLKAENWDFALWQYTTASQPSSLPDQLDEFAMPILVMTGDDDRIVPTQNTIENAGKIPGAELIVLEDCGHVPQEECPFEFLEAVFQFLERLEE